MRRLLFLNKFYGNTPNPTIAATQPPLRMFCVRGRGVNGVYTPMVRTHNQTRQQSGEVRPAGMESAGKVVLRFLCGLLDESAPTRTFGIRLGCTSAGHRAHQKKNTKRHRNEPRLVGTDHQQRGGVCDRGYGVVVKKRGSTRRGNSYWIAEDEHHAKIRGAH